MSDLIPHLPLPTCPHCDSTLRTSGDVVNTGRFKKWVEKWICPTHGTVEPGGSDQDRHTQRSNSSDPV